MLKVNVCPKPKPTETLVHSNKAPGIPEQLERKLLENSCSCDRLSTSSKDTVATQSTAAYTHEQFMFYTVQNIKPLYYTTARKCVLRQRTMRSESGHVVGCLCVRVFFSLFSGTNYFLGKSTYLAIRRTAHHFAGFSGGGAGAYVCIEKR